MFRLPMTASLKALLESRMGKDQEDKVSLYELLVNSTKPIPRTSGMYQNAQMKLSYLQEMASVSKVRRIPIIQNHNQYSRLPDGVVLMSETVLMSDGVNHGLHAIIAVPKNEDAESLDNRLSLGIVNQVSSGSKPSDLYCSECNFHYTKDEDSIEYLNLRQYDSMPMCPNDHKVGVNGVHLKLDGLAYWDEISLVVQGAVTEARVLSENEWVLNAKTQLQQLAASSITDKLRLVTHEEQKDSKTTVDPVQNLKPEGQEMTGINLTTTQYEELVLAKAKANEVDSIKLQLQTAQTALATAEAEKTAAVSAKAELEAAKLAAETQVTELTAQVTALQTQLAALKAPEGGAGTPAGDVETPAALFSAADAAMFKPTR